MKLSNKANRWRKIIGRAAQYQYYHWKCWLHCKKYPRRKDEHNYRTYQWWISHFQLSVSQNNPNCLQSYPVPHLTPSPSYLKIREQGVRGVQNHKIWEKIARNRWCTKIKNNSRKENKRIEGNWLIRLQGKKTNHGRRIWCRR